MRKITARRLRPEDRADVRLPNEPFPLWGTMTVTYDGSAWACSVRELPPEQVTEMTFPDEDYDFDQMQKDAFPVGAYDECGRCVGLAIYRRDWLRYLYLDDLKVCRDWRRMGVGAALLDEGLRIAREQGCLGVYTIGQHNNLSACLFYLRHGFQIGGLNTRVYDGTSQEGKYDIFFYRKL